jgi:hypothetical protein
MSVKMLLSLLESAIAAFWLMVLLFINYSRLRVLVDDFIPSIAVFVISFLFTWRRRSPQRAPDSHRRFALMQGAITGLAAASILLLFWYLAGGARALYFSRPCELIFPFALIFVSYLALPPLFSCAERYWLKPSKEKKERLLFIAASGSLLILIGIWSFRGYELIREKFETRFSPTENRSGTPLQIPVRKEEYAVYSALLNSFIPSPNAGGDFWLNKIELLVIDDYTSPFSQENDAPLKLVDMYSPVKLRVDADVLDEFKRVNKESYPLDDSFNLKIKYLLLSQRGASEFFAGKGGWEAFDKEFPAALGIFNFSRVGFNRNMDKALLCSWNQSNWCAGFGFYDLYVKKLGRWYLKQRILYGVS